MYQYHFNLNVLEVVLILKLRVAAYIRISKKEKEVNSISNQKDLIDYYIKDKEDMKIYNYYVDNGYSGTSFDRPKLKRMLKDISNKKVDIVIVKDLSRLGRNYIEIEYTNIEDFKNNMQTIIEKAKFHKKECIKFAHTITKFARVIKMIEKGEFNELRRTIFKRCRK